MKKRNWSIRLPRFNREMLYMKRSTAIIVVIVLFALIILGIFAVCSRI